MAVASQQGNAWEGHVVEAAPALLEGDHAHRGANVATLHPGQIHVCLEVPQLWQNTFNGVCEYSVLEYRK